MRSRLLFALVVIALPLGDAVPDAAAQSAPTCTVTGTPVLPKTLELFSAASAGEAIAKFTGQAIPLTLTIGASGRARAKTGGGFRLDGFVDAHEVPAFTTRNVPVVASHVWIGAGRHVHVSGAPNGQLAIEIQAGNPIDQRVTATGACDAVSLDPPNVSPPSPPGDARGYVVKKVPLEIRAEAGGDVVFSFTSESAKDALLFWSTERSQAYVHVNLAGDLVVDGWAAASSLEALKKGEMLDAVAPGTTTISQPKLMLQGTPTTIKVPKDIPLHHRPTDASIAIGTIDAGTEVLVLETVLGWSNVVPTSLAVMPADGGGGFWAKSADLGVGHGAPSK